MIVILSESSTHSCGLNCVFWGGKKLFDSDDNLMRPSRERTLVPQMFLTVNLIQTHFLIEDRKRKRERESYVRSSPAFGGKKLVET